MTNKDAVNKVATMTGEKATATLTGEAVWNAIAKRQGIYEAAQAHLRRLRERAAKRSEPWQVEDLGRRMRVLDEKRRALNELAVDLGVNPTMATTTPKARKK
jgi:hypothetical protein